MSINANMNFEEEVYKKYYPLVHSVCRRRLHHTSSVDDAIQSTFLLFIKDQDKIKSDLTSWFYWASINVSIVMNRDSNKHLASAELQDDLVVSTNDDSSICLDQLMASLPKKKRDLLLMRYYDNLSFKEIADKIKCKESNAQKLVERTIALLQSKFKKQDILVTSLLATLFRSTEASSTPFISNSFILQNSLIQQTIVKGVYKMYFISKLKLVTSLLLVLTLPLVGTLLGRSKAIDPFEKARVDSPTSAISKKKSYLKVTLSDRVTKSLIKNKKVKLITKDELGVDIIETSVLLTNHKGEVKVPFDKSKNHLLFISVEKYVSVKIGNSSKMGKPSGGLGVVSGPHKRLYPAGTLIIQGVKEPLVASDIHFFDVESRVLSIPKINRKTNEYIFDGARVGDYEVSIYAKGFETLEKIKVSIKKDRPYKVHVDLVKSERITFDFSKNKNIPQSVVIRFPIVRKNVLYKGRLRTIHCNLDYFHHRPKIVLVGKDGKCSVYRRFKDITYASIFSKGFYIKSVPIILGKVSYDVKLVPSQALKVYVYDAKGKPIEGAIVVCNTKSSTDEKGLAELHLTTMGNKIVIYAIADGYQRAFKKIDLNKLPEKIYFKLHAKNK